MAKFFKGPLKILGYIVSFRSAWAVETLLQRDLLIFCGLIKSKDIATVCTEQTDLQCLSLSEHECPVMVDKSYNSSYICVLDYSMRGNRKCSKECFILG